VPGTRSGHCHQTPKTRLFFSAWERPSACLVCSLEPSALPEIWGPHEVGGDHQWFGQRGAASAGLRYERPADNTCVLAGAVSALVFFGLVAWA
jgi:hypothetical protein